MLRQTSSRNRSKGFKATHILQICLLLVVIMWVLYQVKHSYDKRKAFDEKNMGVSNRVEERHEILNFGRKDLNHGLEMALEMHKDAKEEESAEEEQDGEEEQESKEDEGENEERGVGDDEIDENDQDIADEEEHGEDFIDEEEENMEKEENEETGNTEKEENGGKDDEENEVLDTPEDQNHARTGMNSQKAHEIQYNGDDASNAVVPNKQTIRKIEIGGLEKPHLQQVVNAEKNDLENGINRIEDSDAGNNNTKLTVVIGDDKKIDIPSLDAATNEEEFAQSTLQDKSLNSTEGSNDQTILYGSSPADNIQVLDSRLQNVSTAFDSTRDENATVMVTTSAHGDPSSETTVLEHTVKSNTTAPGDESVTSIVSSPTTNKDFGNATEITRSSNSVVIQEQKDPLTHLGTVPESGQEGENAKDVAA